MNTVFGFKQKLSKVHRLWEKEDFDAALVEVEALRKAWPGNAHISVLWACLVQLQERPKHDLNDAKQALRQAVELDKGSAAAAIELGHFLDAVEDDPRAASKAYADGVATARQQLIEGLIGQARVFHQLEKRDEFLRCLLEALRLAQFETGRKQNRGTADVLFAANGCNLAIQLKGPYVEQIQELLSEAAAG